MTTRALIVLGCLFLMVPQARAIDGVSFELGASDSSNVSVDLARVGVQWNWAWRLTLGAGWHLAGYWDLSVGHWDNDSRRRSKSSIVDLGFTPVFRLQQTTPGEIAPYVELAVGAHYLTKSSLSPQRRLGSRFQFGDHVGLGIRFGPRHAYDLGYRYQHLSNAGIQQPNQGINFHQVRLQYHF